MISSSKQVRHLLPHIVKDYEGNDHHSLSIAIAGDLGTICNLREGVGNTFLNWGLLSQLLLHGLRGELGATR